MKSMAAATDASPICVIERDTFTANLPQGWENVSGRLSNADKEFTVLADDKKCDGRSCCFEVKNLGDLDDAREVLTRQPIFTTAKAFKPQKDTDPDWSASTLTHNFVVLINTGDPNIKSMFDEAFERAEQYLNEGKNFRIKIPISSSVKQFYMTHPRYYVNEQINDTTTVSNCDIYLTHGARAPNCADGCFSCQTTTQKVMWITCFPIYLMTGAPYICYKKCFRGIREPHLEGSFPVKFHAGPFTSGYDLKALLHSPSEQ